MKAIDLYSGIGGWTLGLRLAGIEVVRSYEYWEPANRTHGLNFARDLTNIDIRTMPLSALPEPGSIDFVVGSPPCTQFSFANRGGNGDLADGLVDIRRMLQIVAYLKPRYWAMENVPRVSKILESELNGGLLQEYRDLVTVNEVFDLSKFGLPQSRTRMIAGNLPIERLKSYQGRFAAPTLGEVIEALKQEVVTDPLYGYQIPLNELTDNLPEPAFTAEETRMNRDSKSHHPVYNRMAFPDRLNRPSRTVTATCTRVSRESIVIQDDLGFRRPTLRERALLQGFPVTYQFFSDSYGDRLRMVGNAVPPFFTYQLAMAMLELPMTEAKHPSDSKYKHICQAGLSKSLAPRSPIARFSEKRSFRAAIPGLRFGSGVRFELRNRFSDSRIAWAIDFYYGSSKAVQHADVGLARVMQALKEHKLERLGEMAMEALQPACHLLEGCDGDELQKRWTRRSTGPGPFELVDALGDSACELLNSLDTLDTPAVVQCARALFPGMNAQRTEGELVRILVGALIAVHFNVLYSCWR